MNRFLAVLALALAALALPVLAVAAAGNGSDATATGPTVDTASAIVQLNGEPLATYSKTKPAKGKKIDFDSNAVRSYRAQLSALRNDFKQWLRANAPAAKVTSEFDISLNAVAVQLNGVSLDTLRSSPLVARAEYEGLYYPLADPDPDLGIIDAIESWGANGAAGAGAGVKVAIIDTGIDITHPCFSDGTTKGFTNTKVLDAAVFYNKNVTARFTPADVNGHGSHVSGTVACNAFTPASVSGVTIPYNVSGVAPAAKLGNFNVFPGDVGNARSEDIMNAIDAALAKGYDVANMSLGGGSHGIQDLLSMAVDNADLAGMVVAVAAGNEGPGFGTVSSPGLAPRALTAGATTVPHFVGAPLTISSGSLGLASGEFKTVTADLSGTLGAVLTTATPPALGLACAALPAGSLANKIAVISRGTCTFSTKIRNAQTAGAIAAVIVNNVAGDPVAMAQDGTANQPTIPAYMASFAKRGDLIAASGGPATIGKTLQYFSTSNADIRAGFSSEGPTDVDFRVKPDVMAPGVNVLSAQPAHACAAPPCWAFFQGTSMATPHLAGSAAVVLSQHPMWSTAEVRSAIVNTAEEGKVTSHTNGTTVLSNVNIIGAGRENLASAVNARVALDPVSLSFGSTPSGSGQTLTKTIALTNLGAAGPITAAVTGQTAGNGVTFSASYANGTVTVTMTAAKGIAAGDRQGILRVSANGTEVAHAAVYALIK